MRMNSLKSRAMNCGPLSEMIRGFACGYFSRARCKMTSISASVIDSRKSQWTIERLKPSRMLHRVVEGAAHVDVGNIDMPMLVRVGWLLEAGSFARRFALPSGEQPRLLKNPPNTRGADGHDVRVQH